ncbi:uncharacterized protein LOC124934045 [Impatiens glandulifera]|uniref:uncharacterized protein LOC124934045 n=1 Tax=Impatiens glandulifera TaxID=253017 RepID=UPI001FB12D90|nr:uncharacterized protein LOC124934045 [Impatiens glandulifera]
MLRLQSAIMEATSSVISSSSSSTSCSKLQFLFNRQKSLHLPQRRLVSILLPYRLFQPRSNSVLRVSAVAVGEVVEKTTDLVASPGEMLPKVDKSGRFCSPRAARELALTILYAACLEGSDPVRLFEKRLNVRRETGYEFDKALLTEYNHMSFSDSPVTTETVEEADELIYEDDKESAIEAEILSAPPKLVYSKLILRFTRKLLVAVAESWNNHAVIIDKVSPSNWKSVPAARILEFCILHLAMSEMAIVGTRHQIVINEAVDLAKRFCDGGAARVVNGCLRTFVKDLDEKDMPRELEGKRKVFS